MAAPSSFRSQRDARPPQYRTPSPPPRHAIELLSPHTSSSRHTARNASFGAPDHPAVSTRKDDGLAFVGGDDPSGGRDDNAHPATDVANNDSTGKAGGHSRSGSTIDTLATIALATSPTFASFPHQQDLLHETRPPPTNPSVVSERDDSMERPAKRARSEKAPSPSWLRDGERPATSHISTFDSMKTDAELLLNLARPNNRAPRTHHPPVQADEHSGLLRNSGPGGSANAMRPRHDSRDAVDDGAASLYYGPGVMTPLARMRSRSDGSAMAAKPMINGFMEGTYGQLPYSGAAVEEIPYADRPGRVPVKADNPPSDLHQHPKKAEFPSPVPRIQAEPSDPMAGSEMDVDSSAQAQCAACTLARAPADGGDDAEVTWVNCDGCNRWFHIVCAGFKDDREIRTVDKFICHECRPTHGPTTFLRKSTRPRTAIDYAGLNQGFVKSSVETPEHHYIRPIKEGRISFLPDKFPRLPPELVSARYFEHGVGMTEPIVIPAHLNSRDSACSSGFVNCDVPVNEVVSQDEFDDMIDYLASRERDLEETVDCGQDLLDMVIPESLTVRNVTELFGPDEPVEVIDVKSQQGEDKKWNMRRWADYYYETSSHKPIRNVISLEMSQSPLGRLIRRPKIVRDLDLQDSVWPADLQAVGDYPKVQFYCLMSVADCYTDFHIDFGGSSVFYHILKGKKTFFFIPPKDKHLKKYEEWCNSSSQDTTFLGDQTRECYRVDLSEGDTMLIPSGWIHAVWTPENSLVIGGNFLMRMNYAMQIKVAKIEKDTKVPMKFRYPFFQKIMWYTALKYLAEDPIPQDVLDSFARDESYSFYREYPIYYEFGGRANTAQPGSDYYNSRFYSQAELEGLPDLARYLFRTALIAGGYPVDGVAKEARNAVNRSIPKGQGDPLDTARKFGVWLAWKRGNEPAAEWTRPGQISLDTKFDLSEKKPNSRPSRRSERNANHAKINQQSVLQSADQHLPRSDGRPGDGPIASGNSVSIPAKRKAPSVDIKTGNDEGHQVISKGTGLGPRRFACEACRKRRIRCRHKDEAEPDASAATTQSKTIVDSGDNGGSDIVASVTRPTDNIAGETPRGSNTADPSGTSAAETMRIDRVPGSTASSSDLGALHLPKKPRSKACEECRKSKRRCIHDEAGRIDPQKAHERSGGRAGGTVRDQAPYNEDRDIGRAQVAKVKEGTQGVLGYTTAGQVENAGFADGDFGSRKGLEKRSESVSRDGATLTQSLYASPPALKADSAPPTEDGFAPAAAVAPAASLVSPPTSHSDDLDNVSVPDTRKSALPVPSSLTHKASDSTPGRRTAQHAKDSARLSPVTKQETSANAMGMGSLDMPAETMSRVTIDTSTDHGNDERAIHRQKLVTPSEEKQGTDKRGRRRSSSLASQSQQTKLGKGERVEALEVDADPESLKLIRQLQGQEFGLRKRESRR